MVRHLRALNSGGNLLTQYTHVTHVNEDGWVSTAALVLANAKTFHNDEPGHVQGDLNPGVTFRLDQNSNVTLLHVGTNTLADITFQRLAVIKQ